jgi:hypothetical protein
MVQVSLRSKELEFIRPTPRTALSRVTSDVTLPDLNLLRWHGFSICHETGVRSRDTRAKHFLLFLMKQRKRTRLYQCNL